MAASDHLRLSLLVDGVFQVEVSNIEVTGNSNAQDIMTLSGWVGKTPGAAMLEISGTWAVPITGPEFDVFTVVQDGTYHEIQIPVGAKTIISKGYFSECKISQSVNASTELSATFKGDFEPPQ